MTPPMPSLKMKKRVYFSYFVTVTILNEEQSQTKVKHSSRTPLISSATSSPSLSHSLFSAAHDHEHHEEFKLHRMIVEAHPRAALEDLREDGHQDLQAQEPSSSPSGSTESDESTDTIDIQLANTEGKVSRQRRLHQRQAILAILSYQTRLKEKMMILSSPKQNSTSSAAHTSQLTPAKCSILLSNVSMKFSQRAKDIALEIGRLTRLEVDQDSQENKELQVRDNQELQCHEVQENREVVSKLLPFSLKSALIPISISEFPTIKQKQSSSSKRYREHSSCSEPASHQEAISSIRSRSQAGAKTDNVSPCSLENVPLAKRSRGNAAA